MPYKMSEFKGLGSSIFGWPNTGQIAVNIQTAVVLFIEKIFTRLRLGKVLGY